MKVLAIPKEIKEVLQLNTAFKFVSLVTDGSREAFDTYALLRRSFSEQGTLPDPPVPPHMEFIIDRQGYVRARWIPRDGPGWDQWKILCARLTGSVRRNLRRRRRMITCTKPDRSVPDVPNVQAVQIVRAERLAGIRRRTKLRLISFRLMLLYNFVR